MVPRRRLGPLALKLGLTLGAEARECPAQRWECRIPVVTTQPIAMKIR